MIPSCWDENAKEFCLTTTVLKWIAKRLSMLPWTHVSNCLMERRKAEGEQEKCQ
jgi:hypothetical protein